MTIHASNAPTSADGLDNLSELSKAVPTEWTEQRSSSFAPLDYAENTSSTYAFVYEGTPRRGILVDGADLRTPDIAQIPANQRVTVVTGDPKSQGILQNEYDSQIPGAVVGGKTVTFEKLAPTGEVTDRINATTNKQAGGDIGPIGSELQYATVSLNPGIYRVDVAGSDTPAYYIQVGTQQELLSSQLEAVNGAVTEYAQNVRDEINSGNVSVQRVTTNDSGYWSASLSSSATAAQVQAVKPPAEINQSLSAENTSVENVSQQYTAGVSNQSLLIPSRTKRVEVPNSGVTLRMQEIAYPGQADLGRYQNLSEWLDNELAGLNYSELPQALQDQTVSKDRLQNVTGELERLSEENQRLRQRYEEIAGEKNVDVNVDVDDASEEELRKRVAALQQSISQLQSSVETEQPEVDTGTDTVSLRQVFGTDLDASEVLVKVDYTNGTTRTLTADSEYVSINENVGDDEVVVDDVPLGQAAGADVTIVAATDDGVGKSSTPVRNPSVNTNIPTLDAVKLSSLRPGPGEQVDVTLQPSDPSTYGQIQSVTAYGPDGSTVPANVTGADTATVEPGAAGQHSLRVTYSNAENRNFTVPIQFAAGNEDLALPAGVRAVSSPVGTYAVVGDGLEGGSVDVRGGGSEAQITAEVNENDPPSRVDVYTTDLSLAKDSTIDVAVVNASDGESIDKNVAVTVHMQDLSENALMYRNGDPLPKNGTYGAWDASGRTTTVETLSDENGQLELRAVNNPGILQRINYEIAVRTNGLPFVGYTAPLEATRAAGGA